MRRRTLPFFPDPRTYDYAVYQRAFLIGMASGLVAAMMIFGFCWLIFYA